MEKNSVKINTVAVTKVNQSRRDLTTALWTTPMVAAVALPIHAQTSEATTTVATQRVDCDRSFCGEAFDNGGHFPLGYEMKFTSISDVTIIGNLSGEVKPVLYQGSAESGTITFPGTGNLVQDAMFTVTVPENYCEVETLNGTVDMGGGEAIPVRFSVGACGLLNY